MNLFVGLTPNSTQHLNIVPSTHTHIIFDRSDIDLSLLRNSNQPFKPEPKLLPIADEYRRRHSQIDQHCPILKQPFLIAVLEVFESLDEKVSLIELKSLHFHLSMLTYPNLTLPPILQHPLLTTSYNLQNELFYPVELNVSSDPRKIIHLLLFFLLQP